MAVLSPGAMFAGYVVENVIARGGMGVVYRARETRPDRAVALKVVAPELAADAAFRTRFLRECQLAAAIEHPHVVPVLRVGEDDAQLFIAMRLIRGSDLASVIRTERRLAPPAWSGSWSTSPTHWMPPSHRGSFTETSSRPTSWSSATARRSTRSSSTSA